MATNYISAHTGAEIDDGVSRVKSGGDVDTHVSDTDNPHSVTAAQVGADPSGTASATVAAHEGAADPHPGYVLESTTTATPTAGAIPVARADGTLHPDWLPALPDSSTVIGAAYNLTTDSWTRLGAVRDTPASQLISMASPVFRNLRRVVLDDAGTVYKGISWLDFTKHEDGTAVDLSGGNGQIMVEYLPAYIKTGVIGDWYYILISETYQDGFILHPLFAGPDKPAYNGAYEASVYNFGGTDKLCSIAKSPADGTSAVYPVTTRAGDWGYGSLTTQAGDTLAAARGAGWQQYDFWMAHWERCLMLVGYADYDIPGIVGAGRINLSGGDWINGSYIGPTGLGDVSSGYASAVQAGGTAGWLTDYSQVLGVENPWGHVWKRCASLVSDWQVYTKSGPPYDYTTTAGWDRLLDAAGQGITLPGVNGYGGKPHSGPGMILPADVTGSSSTRMHDYFYQASGLRVLLLGGGAADGASAGPFYVNASAAAAPASATIGGRLCFKKT